MYTYEINFKDGKMLAGSKVIIEEETVTIVNYMREKTTYNKSDIKSVIEKRFFMGEVRENVLFENIEEVKANEESECILWVKTKNQKGEQGFKVSNLQNAIKKFNEYVQYWNEMQEKRHEKQYTFSAKFEDQNGNMTPWKDFKKLVII